MEIPGQISAEIDSAVLIRSRETAITDDISDQNRRERQT
jgi:hypothetical protein